jgi:VIT1/CCC1 family predicted Fe2+/Mn2+ transporter/rubrerythrin
MADVKEIRRLRENLQGEIDGAVVYEAMAEAEQDPQLAGVYRELAKTERRHAAFWAERLGEANGGKAPSEPRPTAKAQLMAWTARRFGAQAVLPAQSAAERRDSRHYDDQPDAVAQNFHHDERMHARVVQAAASRNGGLAGDTLARLEGRHAGGGGNALRAAVLGANDGLVSNLSLVMGVTGAAANSKTILLAGLAGLVAGSCSMAMGEWLSVNSSRELAQKQIDAEAKELSDAPELEKEELVLIYQAKGLDEASAREMADKIFESHDAALDTLAREELGLDPKELSGSAWAAAAASFCLFAFGAIFPVAPFIFSSGQTAVVASIVLSGIVLCGIGAATSLFTGRGLLFSAMRQLLIGWAAAAVTYGIGRLLGVAVS